MIVEPSSGLVYAHDRPGKLSAFTCPECKGPLWELEDGELLRYRCREGHAFTGDSVLDGQYEAIEEALWVALETLTESGLLESHMVEQAELRGHTHIAKRFEDEVRQAQSRASVIRDVLNKNVSLIPLDGPDHEDEPREPAGDKITG